MTIISAPEMYAKTMVLVEWYASDGEHVATGQDVCGIELHDTPGGNDCRVVLPSEVGGVLSLKAESGAIVIPDQVIAEIW